MKPLPLLFLISLVVFSCSRKFDLTDHFDPSLPFKVVDQKPPSDVSIYEIDKYDTRHAQLVSWLKSNKHDWKKTDHNTYAGLIIVSQEGFRILFYRDDNSIIVAYDDEQHEMQQYIREMDSNELKFLIDD